MDVQKKMRSVASLMPPVEDLALTRNPTGYLLVCRLVLNPVLKTYYLYFEPYLV